MTSRSGLVLATSAAFALAGLIAAHFAIIEIGREVATLVTEDALGHRQQTRLWVVDVDGVVWLHSAGESWVERFADNPIVRLERHGVTTSYRATAVPGPHAGVDRALRQKYGLADRWVRFLAPCDEHTVPVRLDSLGRGQPDARPPDSNPPPGGTP